MSSTTATAVNPATGEILHSFKHLTKTELTAKLEQAQLAQSGWQTNHISYRAGCMLQAAVELRERQQEWAELMTQEMGKPFKDAQAEVEKCAWACEYYAKNTANFLADETVITDASKSYVSFQPLGLVLAVMPWNYPFWQVFRFAAPALMAGNGGLLKHASNVPGCAAAIEEIFEKSGFPTGLFTNLQIPSGMVESVIRNPLVKAVTLTGSEPAGRSVAATAGDCLKKTVLELGGSDPYLVLADADLENAAEVCKTSRLLNAGQSCISAKRIIVVGEVYDAFMKIFHQKMAALKVGDPMEDATDIGPMARKDLRDELHEQVLRSIEAGAECLLGGKIPKGQGAYYPPTILTNVKKGMPAYSEELFGPVAAVIRAEDEDEAIHIANDTSFGLGGAVFTKNAERGEMIAKEKLNAGSCFVNGLVKSDPRLPFGGINHSGYGRELSHFGIREFVNIKTVWVR
ncbi:MAG: aldehyde dehydrogenase family protein [Bacteroidetes bacterium]|nr:aldehyde dehydrogenase family protein [Bacteroidota bacterium]